MFGIIKKGLYYRVQCVDDKNQVVYTSCDMPNIFYTKDSLEKAVYFANYAKLKGLAGTILNNFFLFASSLEFVKDYYSVINFVIKEYGNNGEELLERL